MQFGGLDLQPLSFTVAAEVDRLAQVEKTAHVFGNWIIAEFVGVWCAVAIDEAAICGQQFSGRLAVIDEIGGEIEHPAWLQAVKDKIEKILVKQAAFAMPFFRPGVGAVDVNRLQAVFAKIMVKEITGLDAHHADISQPGFFDPAAGLPTALVKYVDGDIVPFWMKFGDLDDKVTYPAADFEAKRVIVPEQGSKAASLFQLRLGDKNRRGDKGHSLSHGIFVLELIEGYKESR